jgi:hypothetical protein
VTLKDVQGLILSVDKIVNARLKIAGHDVTAEIVSASYTDLLETIETLMTAGWVESRFKADDGGDQADPTGDPTNIYYKEGAILLKQLAENNEFDEVANIDTTIDNLTGRDGELDPHFEKNVRLW